MLQDLRRFVSSALLVAYLPVATGCGTTQQVAPQDLQQPIKETISGVTMRSGAMHKFDSAGAIVGDSVVGWLGNSRTAYGVDSVQQLWVHHANTGKTVLLVVGITAAVLVAAGGIAAATKESCPFVYAWDGQQWVFDAEPYGGAISRGLERDDYAELEHLQAENGSYRLLVTNEVHESQETNLMELWVVDHDPGVRVVPDEFGQLHTLASLSTPVTARDQRGTDLVPWLRSADRLIWEPLPVADSTGVRDEITLVFPRPRGADHAKLLSHTATAAWGSHMIRVFLGLRGEAVGQWYQQIDGNPASADSIRRWSIREGLYGLPIEVREADGWHIRGFLAGGGPFIAEDRVIPLDLGGVTGDSVTIRLRPTRGFWAFNAMAMDFSTDTPVEVDTLAAATASDPLLGDVRPLLARTDDQYHPLPNTGDWAAVTFSAPSERPGQARTLILHSRGYYRLQGLPDTPPDVALIDSIMTDRGAAGQFAAAEYGRMVLARRATAP